MGYHLVAMSSKKAKPKGQKTAKKAVSAKTAASTKPSAAAKPVAAAKPAVKPVADKTVVAATRTKGRGVRYDAAKKQEVVDFVAEYNQKNGRGGQSAAARKYGVTILTVSSWLKGSGKVAKAPKAGKVAQAPKAAKVSGALTGKVKALLDLGDRIRKAEAELQKLQGQYGSLSASIRSEI
jgi:transposase-like protein